MDKTIRVSRVMEWSLATFHTAFFFGIVFWLLYLGGGLGGLLASLNTLVGVAVYGLFWGINFWCTHKAFRSFRQGDAIKLPTLGDFISQGAKWGAVNGLLFLFGLILSILIIGLILIIASVAANPALLSGSGEGVIVFLIEVFVALLIGSPIALLIGAVLGGIFGILDATLTSMAYGIFNAVPSSILAPAESHT